MKIFKVMADSRPKCLFCEDTYTPADIAELRETGKAVCREGELFLCPDCFNEWSQPDLEEQQKALALGADYDWEGRE